MDKRIISEVALRCNDTKFTDFQSSVYERALLRASRSVAKRYHLIQRESNFNIDIPIGENGDEDSVVEEKSLIDVVISLPSFTSEYKVIINNLEYTKVKDITDDYQYTLYRDQNRIYFNYQPRTKSDSVHIRYTSDINEEDYDIEELEPIIPSQYEEELIKLTLVEIAKLGIVKFNESSEGGKYTNVLKLYSIDERILEKDLIKDTTWAVIRPRWSV